MTDCPDKIGANCSNTKAVIPQSAFWEEIDQNVLQLNTQKKMVLWALVLLIVLMLVPSLLPKELIQQIG